MSFDLTKNRARGRRRKGEGPAAAAAPAPEPEPRLSFAERFAHTLPAGGAAPMPGFASPEDALGAQLDALAFPAAAPVGGSLLD